MNETRVGRCSAATMITVLALGLSSVMATAASEGATPRGSDPRAFPLRIYAHQEPKLPYTNITYRYNYFQIPISAMTPEPVQTLGELLALGVWDFSGNDQGAVFLSTQVPTTLDETCLAETCGFALPSNDYYSRVDDLGATFDSFTAVDWVGGNRVYGQAFVSREDSPDEYLLCSNLMSTILYDFVHEDPAGFFMQVGDHWESLPASCAEAMLQAGRCGVAGLPVYLSDLAGHQGKSIVDVVGEGTVVLPSGHHIDVLLLRTLNDFGAHWLFDPYCTGPPTYEIHQYTYEWFAPYYGPVVTIDSATLVPDPVSWVTADSATFAFGLFPPLTIEHDSSAQRSLTLTWQPGSPDALTDRYKVYWDTDSAAQPPFTYSWNSDDDPHVAFDGYSATISHLQCGTTYYATVTALYTYTDPDSSIATEYESLLFPTQIHGSPDHSYPTEVAARTGACSCAPATEVTGLRLDTPGDEIRLSWDPVSEDPCLDHYEVFGSDTADGWSGFSSLGDAGLETEWTGNPTAAYYLVVPMGPEGQCGCVGHYGL